MNKIQIWYIVKHTAGNCEILPSAQTPRENEPAVEERWGSFNSPDEALARRVGLIRAGKCKPI